MSSKLPATGTSIFTTMSALANASGAVNLSQGFPDFPIDDRLNDLVTEGLKIGQVQYAPMAGRTDLREEISKKTLELHGIHCNADEEITITAGATQAIFTAIMACVHPGDEVILFDPAYDCYDPAVVLSGGKPVHLKLVHPAYKIDWNEVESRVKANTRLIIVNNPHNPAGSVWHESDLRALETILQRNPQLYVISDEVYEHLQFSGTHQSVLKSPAIRERSFTVYSFGKTFHVTGWKVGYCIAPPGMSAEFRKVHQYNVFCVNNTIQYAIAKYLRTTREWAGLADFYRQKRDLFLGAMQTSKFKALACEGTYFCLFDYSQVSTDSDIAFTKWLTVEKGVAAIPTSVFYEDGADHHVIRFCFAKTDETLLKAAAKLCAI